MRPHIIYYHSHDTGRYVSPYGYKMPTPWIERLASEGVTYRRAFAAAPTCSPSRAGLMTGCAPHTVGMLGLAHQGFTLKDYSKTLIHHLGEAGYHTALCGGQHIIPNDRREELHYREILATERLPTAANAVDHAIECLRNHAHQHPVFLDVGAFETHRYQTSDTTNGPFSPSGEAADGRFSRPPEPIPDHPSARADWADFQAAAARWDEGIGRLYLELERLGILDNTLIICTTDHGPPFPEMKCTLKDFGLQVALILRGPSGFSGGRVEDRLVSQIDLFATLFEMLGLPVPDWRQSVSFLPGSATPAREEVFGEISFHGLYKPQRCVRTRRFKFIRTYPTEDAVQRRTCDASPVKEIFEAAGWGLDPLASRQLYDLDLDPLETNNLAEHPDFREVGAEMEARLIRWMEETHDPLLEGPLQAPAPGRASKKEH